MIVCSSTATIASTGAACDRNASTSSGLTVGMCSTAGGDAVGLERRRRLQRNLQRDAGRDEQHVVAARASDSARPIAKGMASLETIGSSPLPSRM